MLIALALRLVGVRLFCTDVGLDRLNTEVALDPQRCDPRFKNLLHRVGLPELQLADLGAGSAQNGRN